MQVELQPWLTPNFILAASKPGNRQDGPLFDRSPKWSIKDADADTLSEQCDKFRADVFRKAGKVDPRSR